MPNWVANKIEFSGKQEDINKVLDIIKGDDKLFDFEKLIPMPKSLQLPSGSMQDNAIMYALSKKNPREKTAIISFFMAKPAFLYGSYYDKISKYVTDERIERALEMFDAERDTLANKAIYAELGIETFEDLGNAYIDNVLNYGYDTWYDWSCAKWGTKWNACDTYMETECTLGFNTAWSCPLPVLDKLAELCYKHNVEFVGKWADEDMGCNTGIFESYCDRDEYWFSYEEIEDCSNEAYEIYVDMHGESGCLARDIDSDEWIRYDCDDCPNKGDCW